MFQIRSNDRLGQLVIGLAVGGSVMNSALFKIPNPTLKILIDRVLARLFRG